MVTSLTTSLKSKESMKWSAEAKKTWPMTVYVLMRPLVWESSFLTTIKRPILLAKNRAANNTPTKTPMARLCVVTTTATVVIITTLVEIGCFLMFFSESHEKVPIETIIITATKAAIGICFIQLSKNRTIINKKTPAARVDRRPRPPDFTLMIDWPIIAQPAMPPNKPEPMLAIPWSLHSRFLSLLVSVKSSTMVAVIMDSNKPTVANPAA